LFLYLMSSRFIICCLGNPGERYARSRHNLGFILGDELVERAGARWSRPDEDYFAAHLRLHRRDVVVVKPWTYMNLSGRALTALARVEPVPASDTLVVCDDIALPLGLLRLRGKGSDGGHNGLKSIIDALGTPRFPRLRLGVGPVPDDADPADFVTDPMTDPDVDTARPMLREALKCIDTLLDHGLSTAMNRFNRRADRDS
jgi:PTH1 family peptidyl-tRNA hydrolase